MKFYFVYEQAFPYGFGLAAVLCIGLGLFGLVLRRPFVYNFVLSYLVYIGSLVPLFMLSLNHFWVAWPLGLGTLLLNAFGMLATTVILVAFWMYKFEHTVIGSTRTAIVDGLRSAYPSLPESGIRVLPLAFGSICYVWTTLDEPVAVVRGKLREALQQKQTPYRPLGPVVCILIGVICAFTASISWCVSVQCIVV